MPSKLNTVFYHFYTRVVAYINADTLEDVLSQAASRYTPTIRVNSEKFWVYLRKKAKNAASKGHPLPRVLQILNDPPVSLPEALPEAFPEITPPTRYVFSSRRPPNDVSGNFVYYIQPDDYTVSKVGKHSGTLSKLVSRYKNGYNTFDVIAYDCGEYDYSKVEKAVLSAMGARGVNVVREQVATGVGKFFCVILDALLTNTCGNGAVGSVVENDFAKWYRDYAKLFDITNDPKDVISAKDIHGEYNKTCLETGVKLISYKDLVREISTIEDRWVDGTVAGVKMNVCDFKFSDTSSESDDKIEQFLKERVEFTNNLTDHLKITSLLPLFNEYISSSVLKKSLIRILGPVNQNDPRDTRLLGKLVMYANSPHIKGAKVK